MGAEVLAKEGSEGECGAKSGRIGRIDRSTVALSRCEPLFYTRVTDSCIPTRTKPVTERSLESLAALAKEAAALFDCGWRKAGAECTIQPSFTRTGHYTP